MQTSRRGLPSCDDRTPSVTRRARDAGARNTRCVSSTSATGKPRGARESKGSPNARRARRDEKGAFEMNANDVGKDRLDEKEVLSFVQSVAWVARSGALKAPNAQ